MTLVALVVAGGLFLLLSEGAKLQSDASALARVTLPLGGGSVRSVSAYSGPHASPVAVRLRGEKIWPVGSIPAGTRVTVAVVIRRPGWRAWLAGKTERVQLTVVTPAVHLRAHFLTLRAGAPLVLAFREPVRVVWFGSQPTNLVRRDLGAPSRTFTLPRFGDAGSLYAAAAARVWESSPPSVVSWFPAGASTAAVASPAPGTTIGPRTDITLTFSRTVHEALGSALPPVSPTSQGTWHVTGSHTIAFHPEGYGYGLGAKVTVALPTGVRLMGGTEATGSSTGVWRVPPGSTLRLQQLLAQLGYLPLSFNGPQVPATADAQLAAALHPPPGSFGWRYPNVPSQLRSLWSPGSSGEMTKGALMAFQNDHNLSADGAAGASSWRALIAAAASGHGASTAGYTFVTVDKEASPEQLTVWHSGRTVLSAPVNTGIASAPTASGTFAVFEHIRTGTMSGTNPDGSHYNDPGIQYISYFNGGDALHAFTRGQYGFPQSLGCVEMDLSDAGRVWPYTPIGTLVHVA